MLACLRFYYPYFSFFFTLLDRVLQVRPSGCTAYMFPAEGICLCHVSIFVRVCVCACLSVMYSHNFFIMCERAERGGE
jgi:hypothetical protein